MNKAQKVIDAMSNEQLIVTYDALYNSFPLSRVETCNGVNLDEWYTLVYEECDRRGFQMDEHGVFDGY